MKTINKAYGSCVYIHIKDRITIQDLLYGLMLRSGNDCALMLAKSVGGSVERFVEMMNEKARDIGMKQTHFSNPSGLDEEDEGNLSTVKEMAILYRYCCQNPLFNQIVKTKEYKRLDGKGYWHNKNRLLKEYPYCLPTYGLYSQSSSYIVSHNPYGKPRVLSSGYSGEYNQYISSTALRYLFLPKRKDRHYRTH